MFCCKNYSIAPYVCCQGPFTINVKCEAGVLTINSIDSECPDGEFMVLVKEGNDPPIELIRINGPFTYDDVSTPTKIGVLYTYYLKNECGEIISNTVPIMLCTTSCCRIPPKLNIEYIYNNGISYDVKITLIQGDCETYELWGTLNGSFQLLYDFQLSNEYIYTLSNNELCDAIFKVIGTCTKGDPVEVIYNVNKIPCCTCIFNPTISYDDINGEILIDLSNSDCDMIEREKCLSTIPTFYVSKDAGITWTPAYLFPKTSSLYSYSVPNFSQFYDFKIEFDKNAYDCGDVDCLKSSYYLSINVTQKPPCCNFSTQVGTISYTFDAITNSYLIVFNHYLDCLKNLKKVTLFYCTTNPPPCNYTELASTTTFTSSFTYIYTLKAIDYGTTLNFKVQGFFNNICIPPSPVYTDIPIPCIIKSLDNDYSKERNISYTNTTYRYVLDFPDLFVPCCCDANITNIDTYGSSSVATYIDYEVIRSCQTGILKVQFSFDLDLTGLSPGNKIILKINFTICAFSTNEYLLVLTLV